MTDNEIIKALEHLNGYDCKRCLDSGTDCFGESCEKVIAENALDLINRQKAEIEELEAEIEKQYEQAKADILGNMADGGTSCHWCIDQHRAEAVKEFAFVLKAMAAGRLAWDEYDEEICGFLTVDEIDNLLKEFTEGNSDGEPMQT